MWIIVMFDLPTKSRQERKHYTHFRAALLEDGFTMMQYSVYLRHCASEENAQVHVNRVKSRLPPEGEVRIIKITDKQFSKIQVYFGKKSTPIERTPEQFGFF